MYKNSIIILGWLINKYCKYIDYNKMIKINNKKLINYFNNK
jgi:hypothetical protein